MSTKHLFHVVCLLAVMTVVPASVVAERPAEQLVGTFEMSFYWMSLQSDFDDAEDTAIYDKQCTAIATVPAKFAQRMTVEGTGKLSDGRVLNTAGACECGYSPCFFQVPRRTQWGLGVKNRALSPFRSIAVDHDVVPIGTRLYIPELDGLRMPGKAPWGGFVHDGCVIADDRGGAVRGNEIDFFAGHRAYYKVLQRKHRFDSVTAYDGAERCKTFREGSPNQV
jgi:3D (Asp-Asp-Asp) domain-containing protein